METCGPFCHLIDGAPYGIYMTPENLRRALQFQPHEGDIIEVSFFKSGTHWVQQIIQLILNKGESAKDFVEFAKRAPFLEYQGEEALEGHVAPRLIRTHLPLGRIPFSDKAKYVCVARNPWDCCVSGYHFMRQIPGVAGYETFDEYLDLFLRGETGTGDHLKHVISGYNRRMEPNVFFITYEELKRDTSGTIKKLAHFLGPQHGKALEENQELLRTILEKSSMEYMKGIIHTRQSVISEMFLKNREIKPHPLSENNKVVFVREGKVGGWKEIFTRDQLKKMEARILEVCETSDVMNLWKEEWLYAKNALNE